MYDLSFSKEFRFQFNEKIYENTIANTAFYKAFDETENRKVGIKAVKIKKKDLHKAQIEANVIQRFAQLTTSIPALYMTYYDENTETYYLVMQLIEGGRTLREYLNNYSNLIDWIDIMLKLCDTLIPIHENKYQHRDLKPENILIKGRKVYVIDFNLTAAIPFKGEGTMTYCAPEQNIYIKGFGTDNVDVFSLGVILYEMLTGQPPQLGIEYVNAPNCSDMWDFFMLPKVKNPEIPDKLNDIVGKCMELHPKKRYQGALQLKNALETFRKRSTRNA